MLVESSKVGEKKHSVIENCVSVTNKSFSQSQSEKLGEEIAARLH